MSRQKKRQILITTILSVAFWHSGVAACAARLWIPADRAERLTPLMLRAATVRLFDDQAISEFLVPIIAIDQPDPKLESSATFVVQVPRRGAYRLWARLGYPSGQREAFDVVAEIEGQSRVLGLWINHPPGERSWRWQPLREGQTVNTQGGPVATLQLPAGRWEFRLRAHRATATVYRPLKWKQAEPTFNPRVNWLCLTDEPDFTPTDEDAQQTSSIQSSNSAPLHVEDISWPAPTQVVAGRKQPPDWMRVPRWYTKDSWREELAHRRAGDIRQWVRQVAANGGQVLRLSCYWGGETYYQSGIAPRVPGLGDLDYLREALEEGGRLGVKVVFNVYPHRHGTEREARRQALQGLANGAYPNFWSTPGMKPVFDFMTRHAAYLDFSTTTPVKFLALPRDVHSSTTQSATPRGPGVDYKQDRFLAPYVGAYSALMRSGLPIVTLHRPRFEEQLEGFRVLCLANVALLSDAQVAAVRQFVRAGGGLLATHETSLYNEQGRPRDDFALADVLGVRYRKTLPAAAREIQFANHAVAGQLAGGKSFPHLEPHVLAELTTASAAGWLRGNDADRESTPAVVVHSFGKGRVVYLPGRLDARQCAELNSATEQLFANAVNWLADGAVPLWVQAPGLVGVSLYQQPRRYLVHLLNHQRDSLDRTDDFQSIARPVVSVRLPQGARISSVRALWSNAEPPYEQSADVVTVRLPALGEYELLAFDWK